MIFIRENSTQTKSHQHVVACITNHDSTLKSNTDRYSNCAYVAVKANDHLKFLVGSLHRAQLRPWHNNGRTVICRIHGAPPNEAGKDWGCRVTRISYPSEGRLRPLIICSSREPQMQLQGGMVLDLCWLEYCLLITYVIASSI